MSEENKLVAEARTEFGKGAARRIRRDSKVPAVLYGHGSDPIHITLPHHDTQMALKHGGANALLSIELNGKSELALPKQVQKDPIKGFLEHVDLIIVQKGEKVTVEVPVVVTGTALSGTIVTTEHTHITIEAEATHLPESIDVSVEGLDAGALIHAKDLALPTGSVLLLDGDAVVVHVVAQKTAAQAEAELTSDAAPAAEPQEPASE